MGGSSFCNTKREYVSLLGQDASVRQGKEKFFIFSLTSLTSKRYKNVMQDRGEIR